MKPEESKKQKIKNKKHRENYEVALVPVLFESRRDIG